MVVLVEIKKEIPDSALKHLEFFEKHSRDRNEESNSTVMFIKKLKKFQSKIESDGKKRGLFPVGR